MDKQYYKRTRGIEEGHKTEIHIVLLKQHQKEYQTGKRQAKMQYIASSSRNSPPFTTD